MMDSERQKHHFEKIHDQYEAHYYDAASMAYRDEFIYRPLFDGLDFNGKSVADLASGSGHNSKAVLEYFPGASVTGFDISPKACRAYEMNVGHKAYELDLTKPLNLDLKFDAAMVIGGLHHCVSDLPQTIKNISRLVKPNGLLLMVEPNSAHFLEAVRKRWYKLDAYFDEDSEHALDHDEILSMAAPYFTEEFKRYMGGPAYFFVLNSMIMRVPLKLKPYISPPFMVLERCYSHLPGRAPFNVFLARWQRTDVKL